MSTTDRGTYQMLWDCPYCGTEKLLGLDHRHCPSCGAAQDPERRYFPDEADKVAVEDHQFTGADRVCGSCDTPNGAASEFCGNCGSPLTEAAEARRRATQTADASGDFEGDSARAARDEFKGGPPAAAPPEPPRRSPLKLAAIGCVVLVLAALVCGGLASLLWKKDAAFTATGHRWERTVAVESYKAVSKSAWKDDVPAGARSVRCTEEVRDHKKVAAGETCSTRRVDQGDGTFKEVEECQPKYRKEPVYDDKCAYSIDEWVVVRTEKASGSGTSPAPTWPTVRTRGKEREGKKTERYTLTLKDKTSGKSHDCAVPQSTWSKASAGSAWSGKVGVVTGSLDCDTLKAR